MKICSFCVALFISTLIISCKNDKVERLETASFRDVVNEVVSRSIKEADAIILKLGYEHTQPQSPFNIGYTRGDTSFIYLLSDTQTHLIVATQLQEIKTSPQACIQEYVKKTTINSIYEWNTWHGMVTIDSTKQIFTDHARFLLSITSLIPTTTEQTAFLIEENGSNRLTQFQLQAKPIQTHIYAVVYVINLKQ